jgi:hypothetical protein
MKHPAPYSFFARYVRGLLFAIAAEVCRPELFAVIVVEDSSMFVRW